MDYLAELNSRVHVADPSVGPRCVVVCRNKKGSSHKWGSRHAFYNRTTRDGDSAPLPTIATGMDIDALAGVMMPLVLEMFQRLNAGEPQADLNVDELNAGLARLPETPDEDLR
jgi:hypothetical protein